MVEVRDRGRVVPEYLSWFHDSSFSRDMPERSHKKIKDQRTTKRLREELKHARVIIAKQQARIHLEMDYHSALQDMKEDPREAEKEIVRLEEKLESRITLVRHVKEEQNTEILKL
ncbi:hypothetical protein RND71_007849 [Anisodus tanguticus]|uniref:Uncharacterized protein n=1 Tax=Anisodus tanguticus TaxID=243964 RepID=A0AAE1SM46_9SOLA|nr:hypothetical protein RND71_007849 [Anisodus tanguticus]